MNKNTIRLLGVTGFAFACAIVVGMIISPFLHEMTSFRLVWLAIFGTAMILATYTCGMVTVAGHSVRCKEFVNEGQPMRLWGFREDDAGADLLVEIGINNTRLLWIEKSNITPAANNNPNFFTKGHWYYIKDGVLQKMPVGSLPN